MRVATSLALILVVSLPWATVSAQGLGRLNPFGNGAADGPGGAPAPSPPPTTPPPSQPLTFVTRQAEIEVPFTVKAATTADAQPTAVNVFVSYDQGKTWNAYLTKRPDEGSFRFQAKRDGEYWFATQTVDRLGRTQREGPKSPQLRLILDTQKPDLQVGAEPLSGGQITVSWRGADPHLNATSLKVEYQDVSGGAWQTIVAEPAGPTAPGQLTGRTVVQPQAASGSINLRAEISDAAGNIAYYSQRITLTRPAAGALPSAPPLAMSDPAATPWPADNGQSRDVQLAEQGASGGHPASMTASNESNSGEQTSPVVSNPYTRPGQVVAVPKYAAVQGQTQPPVASGVQPLETLPPPPSMRSPNERPLPGFSNSASAGSTSSGIAASPAASSITPYNPWEKPTDLLGSRDPSTPQALPAPDNAPSSASRESLPAPDSMQPTFPEPIAPQRSQGSGGFADESQDFAADRPRLTNSKRFSLDYDVETVGPEGLADVELWGTTDNGRTWMKWGSDPDKASPFDVEVTGEGTFGYRVVIVGKNGLASNTPQAGDSADIWVGVDQSKPSARLTAAAYGSGLQAGKLDIRWDANDANLGPRPITVAMAESPDGPYTPIAAGLPNTGQYYWDFDPRSPRQIYLRLEVRDGAGNLTIDQLSDPIQVEGLAPKGRIRGFAPSQESQQGAFRSPLFR